MLNSLKKILLIIRILLIILAIAIFVWIFWQILLPGGYFEVIYTPAAGPEGLWPGGKAKSDFISEFYPNEILEDGRILVEPVYFKVRVPRVFRRVRVIITFQNDQHPLFQIGTRIGHSWDFQFCPLENKVLEELDWSKISEKGVTLWQKEEKFSSIHEFVNNLPKTAKILTHNYHFSKKVIKGIEENVAEWNVETPMEDSDYVIAHYFPPEDIGGGPSTEVSRAEDSRDEVGINWKKAEVIFENPIVTQGQLEFMLSAPKLQEEKNEIKIGEIKLIFEREPVTWQNFWSWLKYYIKDKLRKL
jgi:hypothetical protein